jgi:Autophagy receptor ATG43
MSSSLASELAGTIQAGHIQRHPDPLYDYAPATASEGKELVSVFHSLKQKQFASPYNRGDVDSIDDDDEDIPYSVLRPTPRSNALPPLPDLRFEQSYLNSISKADTWGKVALITLRDQVRILLAEI